MEKKVGGAGEEGHEGLWSRDNFLTCRDADVNKPAGDMGLFDAKLHQPM